uniref:Uncharacterized protein n=1 Tax=Rangifer tarandus platyrhynchus TaxID=3082113 RepID=A0ACB0FCM3_RANTA|nr:unnamed protein product [Rangifer tarandus platyrhynchus]
MCVYKEGASPSERSEHKGLGARACLASEEQQGFQRVLGALMSVKAMSGEWGGTTRAKPHRPEKAVSYSGFDKLPTESSEQEVTMSDLVVAEKNCAGEGEGARIEDHSEKQSKNPGDSCDNPEPVQLWSREK